MKPDLCNGCKHFLQHSIGLSSACNARLNVEALGTGTRNTSVRDKHVGDEGHTIVIQCEIQYHDSLLTQENPTGRECLCDTEATTMHRGKKIQFCTQGKRFYSLMIYFIFSSPLDYG